MKGGDDKVEESKTLVRLMECRARRTLCKRRERIETPLISVGSSLTRMNRKGWKDSLTLSLLFILLRIDWVEGTWKREGRDFKELTLVLHITSHLFDKSSVLA